MKFWASWYHERKHGGFELRSPWWVSGLRCADDAATIVAALVAPSEDEAIEQVYAAYDNRPDSIEIRFIGEKPSDWSPFCERFPRRDWMVWA